MRKPVRSSGQIVLVFIFLWVILFGGASSARAQRIIYRESIPTGQTIEGDVVLIGTDVVVDGTVNGDVLAIGMTITINGDIQGSLLSAGVSEIIAGEIGGSLYSGALTLELESQARVARSVYFAGLSLITQAGSQIRQALISAAFGAQLNGGLGGDIRAVFGPLGLARLILEPFGVQVQIPWLDLPSLGEPPGATPTPTESGSLIQPDASQSVQVGLAAGQEPAMQGAGIDWARVGDFLPGLLRQPATLFVFGLVGLWRFPWMFSRGAEEFLDRPWRVTGVGLLALVIAFNVIGLAFLSVFLILVISLWLQWATLTQLAMALFVVSLGVLLLGLALFVLFVLQVSKTITAHMAGKWILERFAPPAGQTAYLSILLGLVLYVLLAAVPLLGLAVVILAISIGLGAAWRAYRERRRTVTVA